MTMVAAIQMASGPTLHANLHEAEKLIAVAAQRGAALIVLPECFAQFGLSERERTAAAEPDGGGPMQNFLAEQARKNSVWLVGGTVPLRGNDARRARGACLVYDQQGARVARFDKIHLFDVQVGESEQYHESEYTEPGAELVIVDSPVGRLGLAVCYDLRFPELFRSMALQHVDVFAVPSAFTAVTGKAHWELLVRARAVENLSYVIAAAQGGYHANGRETYGDSMIVDPWGNVLDRLPRGSGVVLAGIDLDKLRNTRQRFPVLEHRRLPVPMDGLRVKA